MLCRYVNCEAFVRVFFFLAPYTCSTSATHRRCSLASSTSSPKLMMTDPVTIIVFYVVLAIIFACIISSTERPRTQQTSQPFTVRDTNIIRQSYGSSSHATISSNHSGLLSVQNKFSGHYQSYSLVKTVSDLAVDWYYINDNSECELRLLTSNTWEYEKIRKLFMKTTQRHFQVSKIYRVQNPYLLGCYLLKKQEMKSRYGYVSEEYLFHGTKEENRDNICLNNFNWRKHGESVGNIFGKGVSFTPISCYASHYSDKYNTLRMMFVSKVLIANKTKGNKNMKIPPVFDYKQGLRYDTATKDNRQVIVKFSDNEFYPSYVVYYTGQYVKKEQTPIRI